MTGKVDIVVERQWHAPALARALMRGNGLGRVFTGFPKSRYTAQGIPPEKIRSHPLPAVWNLAVSKLGLPPALRRNEPACLASSVAASRELSPVVTCLATSYQHLFPKLLSRPVVRVIECGSMHPEDHFHFQQRARREAGLLWSPELPGHVAEEIEASKLAHFLVCGSRMVVESYVSRGYDPERVLLCPYGVDTERFRFHPREAPLGRPIRIATVGLIGIRKGILRLLRIAEWAQASGIPLELHLIGPVDPEAEDLISRSSANCHRLGVLKGEALVQALHQADLYCLPSYEEGFPISQLEAMATGLPAITSNDTGGREAVTDGTDGIVLSDFTPEEFDARLRPWLSDPTLLPAAGSAAASKARELYSLDAYSRNVGSCYAVAGELAARALSGESIRVSHRGNA
ncbi:MAG: glycosyltransferase [Verrucomicrobiaceae bacterium]|nr:MAG: glycosyltransferase [Verrucomicrobiaceae bacterium]